MLSEEYCIAYAQLNAATAIVEPLVCSAFSSKIQARGDTVAETICNLGKLCADHHVRRSIAQYEIPQQYDKSSAPTGL